MITEQQREEINKLLLSDSEEDNKLAISILVRNRKSPANYISNLYTEYPLSRTGDVFYREKIAKIYTWLIQSYWSQSAYKPKYRVLLRPKWKTYIKSIK